MSSNQLPIRVVCATRLSREQFFSSTSLGKSIELAMGITNVEVRLYPENSSGLSEVYNHEIHQCIDNCAILVFVHDDVLLCDFFWTERIRDGLEKFDIVGVVGNLRRVPKQPSWAFGNLIEGKFTWDAPSNLSGACAHGTTLPPSGGLFTFGPVWQECKLLDGLLLAVKSETLINSKLRFDENFKYHFYDLDFCRQAEIKNLTMGTIPLSVAHESEGNLFSAEWVNSYQTYLNKWKE